MEYKTIVCDPPWEYAEPFPLTRGTGKDHHILPGKIEHRALAYPSMTIEAICAIPVSELAGQDSRLFLWTTNRYLPHAFRVLEVWGFKYKQTLVWHKPDMLFVASVAPNNAEFLLVATRGKPARTGVIASSVTRHGQRQLRHSQKPECFLDFAEQVSPGPYLEMFARRNRLGWDTWGNECLEHVAIGGERA